MITDALTNPTVKAAIEGLQRGDRSGSIKRLARAQTGEMRDETEPAAGVLRQERGGEPSPRHPSTR